MVPNTTAVPPIALPARPKSSTATTSMDDALPASPAANPLLPRPTRPDNTRSSTDPSSAVSPSMLLQGYFKDRDNLQGFARPRNRSPYSRSHLRSRSSGAVAGLPLMTRAHSMPSPHIARPFADAVTPPGSAGSLSPAHVGPSPGRTPVRTRSPFKPGEEGKGWADVGGIGIESIQEDSELDLGPRSQVLQPTALHASRVPSASGRRRPASPLSGMSTSVQTPTSVPADYHTTTGVASHSASSSPSLAPQKEKYVNEAYPPSVFQPQHALHHHASTGSMASLTSFSSLNSFTSYPSHPSTPTSARSRSPSISSLDTIEDEPEMEAIERLKEAAEREEGDEGPEGEGRRRSSLDGPRPVVGFGFTRGRSERKRWSVCGGERRGDLDLETIWED